MPSAQARSASCSAAIDPVARSFVPARGCDYHYVLEPPKAATLLGNRDRIKRVDAGRVTYESGRPRTARQGRPQAGFLIL